jgi:exopolysaccharide production protein ExoZ
MKRSATRPVSTATNHRTEFISIQYLRALAALGVVLWHGSISLLDHERFLIPMRACTAGVDVFFVISGFIMFYTTVDRPVSPQQFYLRRLIRIVPPYLAFTTAAFLIARAAPGLTRTFSPRILDYLRSILFIPYFNSANLGASSLTPLVRPEVGQGWTLNYEIFFYAIFGACLLLPPRLRVRCLVLICVTLSLVGAIAHPKGAILSTYTDPLLLEFIFGVLLGYFFVRHFRDSWTAEESRKKLALAGAAFVIVALTTLITQNFFDWGLSRSISFGVPALSLVSGALLLERSGYIPRVDFMLLLGNASYTLYLMHIFVLGILRRVWQHYFRVDRLENHLVFILAGAVICEVAAILVFLYAERPVTSGISSYLKRRGFLRSERYGVMPAREEQPVKGASGELIHRSAMATDAVRAK